MKPETASKCPLTLRHARQTARLPTGETHPPTHPPTPTRTGAQSTSVKQPLTRPGTKLRPSHQQAAGSQGWQKKQLSTSRVQHIICALDTGCWRGLCAPLGAACLFPQVGSALGSALLMATFNSFAEQQSRKAQHTNAQTRDGKAPTGKLPADRNA
jgi:hypothetical protein